MAVRTWKSKVRAFPLEANSVTRAWPPLEGNSNEGENMFSGRSISEQKKNIQIEGPFILSRVPVELAHRAGLDGHLRDGGRGGDVEDVRVHDLDAPARELRRGHL